MQLAIETSWISIDIPCRAHPSIKAHFFYWTPGTNVCSIIFPRGVAKWEAWNSMKGMGKDEAMAKYVEKVETLKESHGLSE